MNGWLQILFARPPVPGKVKTRLAAFLGPQGAATLYRRLLEHSLRELRQPDVALEIHSATGEDRHVLEALASGLQVRVQAEGDLGERTVREVMRTELVTADPNEAVADVVKVMKERGFGCMPVVYQGTLVGLLSRTDLQRLGV